MEEIAGRQEPPAPETPDTRRKMLASEARSSRVFAANATRPRLVQKFRSWWKGNYQEYVRSFISNSFVLDVGCGSHKVLPEAVGIDINLWSRPDILASAESTPFRDGSFDHVTCLEVIEHVDDPALVFDELRRVLKIDGSLLVTTPNSNWLWSLLLWGWLKFLRFTGQPMEDWNTEHKHTLNTVALERLAERRFTVRSRKRINLFLMMYELVKTKFDDKSRRG